MFEQNSKQASIINKDVILDFLNEIYNEYNIDFN